MARQKITKTAAKDLPDLTPKEMRFCQLIVNDGMTASDAYRKAFARNNWLPVSVWAKASHLRRSGKVQAWIDALRMAAGKAQVCTITDHLAELERLRMVSEASGNMGAAVQAEQLRGKVAGHYVEKILDVTSQKDEDLIEKIREELGDDIANGYAERMGLH